MAKDKTAKSPEQYFLDQINNARKEGYGCVPLLGAGLSAPSGIPIITELHGYLQKCIAMAFGINLPGVIASSNSGTEEVDIAAIESQRAYRWLPGRDDWPPFVIHKGDGEETANWSMRIKAALDRAIIQEKLILKDKLEGKKYAELKELQEGYGATAEWRSALIFLSRLRIEGNRSYQLTLREPDLDIVDTFFLHVVSQKKPTLGHYMLALLTGPLRIRTALTTNFDELVELAFDQTFNDFTVFDVHVESGLPSYRDMQGQNSLVKLHGGRYGLRADYSLDQPPTDDDLRHFCSYLADRHITSEAWKDVTRNRKKSQSSIPAARYLLIVGSSISDKRILSMISIAAEVLEGFKIFWVCGRKKTVPETEAQLAELFSHSTSRTKTPSYAVINHQYPGLLFLELFQRLTRGLPPRGCIFPSPPRVPVPPEFTLPIPKNKIHSEKLQEALQKELERSIDNCFSNEHEGELLRFVLLHGQQGRFFGAISAASEVFAQQIDTRRQAVWIDLDEIRDCNALFEIILHTISRKAGISEWIPVLLDSDSSDSRRIANAQINEIARLTNNPNRQWLIFLNARSGAGSVNIDNSKLSPNGWLDQIEINHTYAEYTANGQAFWQLLSRVCGHECKNVTVILLCYDGPFLELTNRISEFSNGNDASQHHQLIHIERIIKIENIINDVIPKSDISHRDFKSIARKAILWADTPGKKRFLFCLCLVNRMRYASIVWSWPFHETQHPTEVWSKMADDWLDDLENEHVVRRKKGGFVWIHSDVRNYLRYKLIEKNSFLKKDLPSIHNGLSEWYHRLLASSNDPMTAFEIIYHRVNEALARIDKENKVRPDHKKNLNSILICIGDIIRVLEIARPAILSWGFSKGICHELYLLRYFHLTKLLNYFKTSQFSPVEKKHARELMLAIWELSLKMNRDLAREVGENTIAIKRHYQLRIAQYARYHSPDTFVETVSSLEKEMNNTEHAKRSLFYLRILYPHGNNNENYERLSEWISSWNELATLGIAIRSYAFSIRCFEIIYSRIKFPTKLLVSISTLYKDSKIKILDEWINQFINGDATKDDSSTLRFLVKTLQREQQLALAQGHLFHMLSRRKRKKSDQNKMKKEARSCFHRASRAYEIAQVMQKYVGLRGVSSDSSFEIFTTGHSPKWYDDRQRLLTQEGLAVAFKRDYRKAHRRLNEAEAALAHTKHPSGSMEQAIIELHRAEVLTHEAVFVFQDEYLLQGQNNIQQKPPFEKAESSALGQYRTSIISEIIKQKVPNFNKLRKECCINSVPSETFRSSMLCVEDGWQTLDRASAMLKSNRKNVWWTTWYYEIRIKLIEVSIYAKLNTIVQLYLKKEIIPSGNMNLPYIGLDQAPFGTPTIADQIIEDAERVIRLDLFRYLRIMESYANISIAYALWRSFTNHTSKRDVPWQRQLEMFDYTQTSMEGLTTRLNRRTQLDKLWASTKLDENILESISIIQTHVKKINELVSATLHDNTGRISDSIDPKIKLS
ncbi:hypothetical protein [Gimesia chilikensis]|uniref:SIR2-like domain-containing protein n=1 Tax=Gimesia chilikensis TaxID=2605989 RepID=A0A517PYB7_9PLAN|nr:hypothetical protein [Gimesia chilikensis]QDT24376.1 hypothetical protein HG66A1_62080 [Gimesia chilikensis]